MQTVSGVCTCASLEKLVQVWLGKQGMFDVCVPTPTQLHMYTVLYGVCALYVAICHSRFGSAVKAVSL